MGLGFKAVRFLPRQYIALYNDAEGVERAFIIRGDSLSDALGRLERIKANARLDGEKVFALSIPVPGWFARWLIGLKS